MRLIHVLVAGDRRDAVLGVLDDRDVEYVVVETDSGDEETVLVEFPLPSDGVGDVLDALDDAGLDDAAYSVIGTAETASTPTMEALENRYADDFDPLRVQELRSKARDMAHDRNSFVWMILLSALIATAGLLVDSPAVVVGSMVIAPFVGPVLTAAVGGVTGDREMLRDSVRLQALGIVVAVVSSLAFGYALRALSLVPQQLEITALGQISSRVAPSVLTLAVGLAAGSASAFGLSTKGPTSLIGVMIAAALIPAAATAGIAVVWGFPLVALGSLILLVISLLTINVAAYATLRYLGYGTDGFDRKLWNPRDSTATAVFAVSVLALALVVGGAVAATYQQVTYERSVNRAVDDVLDDSEYANLTFVESSVEYGSTSGLLGREGVTVTISRTTDREYPALPNRLQRRITGVTDRNPSVRVRFVDYEVAGTSTGSASMTDVPVAGPLPQAVDGRHTPRRSRL
ncbi:TIGR00341 family protein [Halorussus halobius]|uniref:TIGR00341 family protein n=1 Tax=Halorussus halobius TaxID=1710537 RepID=UPI00109271D3|nr:TIGR00341 family protein [Halorussus halobius]